MALSEEKISVARFVRGFSNAVWSGIGPKRPIEAKTKINGIHKETIANKAQNQRLGFEKFLVFFLFLTMCYFILAIQF